MFASCWFSGCVCLLGVTVITFICTHQKVFFTLYTEPEFIAMRQDYHLVLGREEEHVLRREIWAVTLAAWIYMVVLYLALPRVFAWGQGFVENSLVFILCYAGYGFLKTILSALFSCFSPDKSGSSHCSVRPRALLRKICHDVLWYLFSLLMISAVVLFCCGIQFYSDPHVSEDMILTG